ncbi:CBO0543 family protein [Neobacillus sp. NRS-1170]|uniref:CBO0543 family protein n=1 Tax=Neobacillus sp. NRS-1170 TaxID=3233898 RepID=UPI003D2C6F7A
MICLTTLGSSQALITVRSIGLRSGGTKRVEYPVRPLPKIFKTNIVYDILFFPILSVIWVKISYNDNFGKILLKSLIFSVPMSVGQWFMEKNTRLFKWNKWSPFHTFASVNFTLFTIRGFHVLPLFFICLPCMMLINLQKGKILGYRLSHLHLEPILSLLVLCIHQMKFLAYFLGLFGFQ